MYHTYMLSSMNKTVLFFHFLIINSISYLVNRIYKFLQNKKFAFDFIFPMTVTDY